MSPLPYRPKLTPVAAPPSGTNATNSLGDVDVMDFYALVDDFTGPAAETAP